MMGSERPSRARRVSAIVRASVLIVLACMVGCSQEANQSPHEPTDSNSAAGASRPSISLAEFKREVVKAGVFSGGEITLYESVGRQSLSRSIGLGLMPNDKLLDLGAGSLRIGWWFLHYIKPENYYAVDPSRERLDVGADLLGVDINRFYNDDWEFPDVKFDFVFARSIWTHASKWMISKTLSEFVENSSPKGRLLTSVILAESDAEDYKGSEWIPLAVIKHSMDWIQSECEKNGLDVTRVGGNLYSQTWLLITKAK